MMPHHTEDVGYNELANNDTTPQEDIRYNELATNDATQHGRCTIQ
jgi:hypothetical protein